MHVKKFAKKEKDVQQAFAGKTKKCIKEAFNI